MHMRHPRLSEAQVGAGASQSTHTELPGISLNACLEACANKITLAKNKIRTEETSLLKD